MSIWNESVSSFKTTHYICARPSSVSIFVQPSLVREEQEKEKPPSNEMTRTCVVFRNKKIELNIFLFFFAIEHTHTHSLRSKMNIDCILIFSLWFYVKKKEKKTSYVTHERIVPAFDKCSIECIKMKKKEEEDSSPCWFSRICAACNNVSIFIILIQ